jgi:hypothetical protein
MEGGQMAAYAPSRDSRAARCEEQHLQRLMTDVAGAERAGDAAPEISRHRVCRIDAQPASCSCPGVAALGVRLVAASSGEAAERARARHGRDGGFCWCGGYRISSILHVLPGPGELF